MSAPANINVLSERKIGLSQLARELKRDRSVVERWFRRGVRGHKLGTALDGGKRVTSWEEYDRWQHAINGVPAETLTAKQVKTAHELAAAELERRVGEGKAWRPRGTSRHVPVTSIDNGRSATSPPR
jgi:hypothetical protein